MQVLVIDVKEPKATAAQWAKHCKFSFPVLLDTDGKVAAKYAPLGVQPDLPRDQVPIASNLIIDQKGTIQFFSLLDSVNFDAKLVQLTAHLEKLLAGGNKPSPLVSIKPPAPVSIVPGGKAEARLSFVVAEGFHVQANPPSDNYLVPTKLQLELSHSVYSDSPKYPPGKRYRLQGSETDLLTYEGSFELGIVFHASADAKPGDFLLHGKLSYQACNSRSCLAPTSIDLELPVRIARGSTDVRRN